MRRAVAHSSSNAEAVTPPSHRRAPRVSIADVVGALVCCAIVVIAFSPVVFGGRTLSAAGKGAAGVTGTAPFPGQPPADYSPDFRPDQGASTWQFEPWARVNQQTYSEGELPFWNPYQGSGAPQAANMQSAPFDPLLLAVNLHPTQRVWDFSIVGAFVLGALATFVFARARPLHGARRGGERHVFAERLLLPLQQQSVQPLLRLPPHRAHVRRAHAALPTIVAGSPVGARGHGEPRRGDAGGIVLRARCGRRLRSRPRDRAATGGPRRTRAGTRGRWIPARSLDRIPPAAVVSSIRSALPQHAQGVVRAGIRS